ncbi:MAG: FAD-binding oxidoreductase [Hyphomicrobiaceae bacterium]|nr:FAD-binding oxidoreductase [Hyphomicrobiaceae bacterium]
MQRADVLVLGAGMVGVSTALHLQRRGASVVLIDRRGVAEETSYGNAGLIQREGIVPYAFPRDLRLLSQYAFNMLPEAHFHWGAMPAIAPWLVRYFLQSTPERITATAKAAKPLVERCVAEHEVLMTEAGIIASLRRTGYLKLFRTEAAFETALAKSEAERAAYGVNFKRLAKEAVGEMEPHLRAGYAGAIWLPDPGSVADPSAVGKAYARLFQERGGRVLTGDAKTLAQRPQGWEVETGEGIVRGASAVLCLGPWASDVFEPLGYIFPLGVKRGYHMHYKPVGNAVLNRPVLDAERGYVLAPMSKGIRLTTGAEFADRDAAPTPVQLDALEPVARDLFPLGERADAEPWLGRRPCLPDMLPVIGPAARHDGLWFNFGHHHLGFTLGPVTGRLVAEMMTDEVPFTDPAPYAGERFGG